MKRVARALSVAFLAHAAVAVVATFTAIAVESDLRARGVDVADPHALIELFVRSGLSNPPARVALAGALAALFLTPLLEMSLAAAAAGKAPLLGALKDGMRLTPPSIGASAIVVAAAALLTGIAALVPVTVHGLTEDVHDDLRRAGFVALASLPAALSLAAAGVAIDSARLRIALGDGAVDAALRGIREAFGRLLPLYLAATALGVGASAASARLALDGDPRVALASSALLLARPLARALFMLVAARVVARAT